MIDIHANYMKVLRPEEAEESSRQLDIRLRAILDRLRWLSNNGTLSQQVRAGNKLNRLETELKDYMEMIE